MDNMANESGLDNDWLIIESYDSVPLGDIVKRLMNRAAVHYPICLGLDECQ